GFHPDVEDLVLQELRLVRRRHAHRDAVGVRELGAEEEGNEREERTFSRHREPLLFGEGICDSDASVARSAREAGEKRRSRSREGPEGSGPRARSRRRGAARARARGKRGPRRRGSPCRAPTPCGSFEVSWPPPVARKRRARA